MEVPLKDFPATYERMAGWTAYTCCWSYLHWNKPEKKYWNIL